MRRFELVDGSSSKFWEVDLAGTDLTVRFGRIGTQGQTKTKGFTSAAAAQKEHDSLVQEKTGKGYREVGVAAGAVLAAAPPAAAQAPAAVPAASAPPQAAPPEPRPAKAPVPADTAIEWPDGGFDWTDALRDALPVVRGIRTRPLPDREALFAKTPVFVDDGNTYRARGFAELAQALQAPWAMWDAKTSVEKLRPQSLQQADPEFWRELCIQCLTANLQRDASQAHAYYYHHSEGLAWATQAGLALHGLPFMVELALDLARGLHHIAHAFARLVASQLELLRQAIALCGDAAHDEVIALLDRQAGSTPTDRLVRAELCPHRSDWALASMADDTSEDQQYLRDCVVPPEAMRLYLAKGSFYFAMVEGALLLQLHLHGDAALDLIGDLLRRADRDNGEKLAALAGRMRSPRTIRLLVELIERKETRASLDKLALRYPAAALLCAVEHALSSRSRLAEGWAVRLALREPAALAQASPALQPGDRQRFADLLKALDNEEAAPEQLPPLLREPPWLRKERASELPTLDVAARATPDRIDWAPADRERYAACEAGEYRRRHTLPQVLTNMQITPDGQARVMAGQPLHDGDVHVTREYFSGEAPEYLLMFPPAARLALWNSYPARYWYQWSDNESPIRAMLAKHGEAALPGFAAYVQAHPETGLVLATAVDSASIVPTALHALRKLKKAKVAAIAWLKAHAATALAVALPLAFGKDKALRDNAQFGVRWMAANGNETLARDTAAGYGPAMAQALQALLDADPLQVLPSRMPKLPGFFVAPSFRRPLLREGGGALPPAALEHLGSMLAISTLEAPYPGLAIVKEACTPASLAEFAWDLFEAWLASGAPSKEGWAFTALGLLGDDETARRLAPRIREWPGESAHQRAVTGLDLLAAIGTDVALMHLNGIAGKVKFKALQDRAKEKIAVVAEARGFTAAELADRLVPDLGLDDAGALRLDFGPRHFTVGFDETLKPFVKDAQGVRLKDLPKPIRSDDAALAEAATERFKQLKKDAKAIASLQVTRLEMSMVERRRWSAADFRMFFVEHPLMRHLAARVVWGVYDAQDTLSRGFRIAEDWTLADADDAQASLPDDATLGIVHVLEMPPSMRDAFGQIFADYEILQPFKQLGRETYALTDDERRGSEIKRFEAKTVATGSVMGLVNRGWERGAAQDAGWVGWFGKRVGDGLEVQLELDPGTVVGDIGYEPRQRIPRIVLRQAGTWADQGRVSFDRLDPVIASEVLRDAELLAPFKESA